MQDRRMALWQRLGHGIFYVELNILSECKVHDQLLTVVIVFCCG